MTWSLLTGLVLILGLALFGSVARRAELKRMAARVRDREVAVRSGAAEAQLQHPVVDLSRCLGCGTCVAACPEDNVLELVHGQAVVVNGARCQGISACERECPVGAITVTIANLEERRDVPVLTEEFEAIETPGLFLAGEITAHALIKTAVEHGAAVAREAAQRVAVDGRDGHVERGLGVADLCIVGAGPAGIACALEAKRLGLDFVAIEQETRIGGTVAKYPRRKLVLSEPVDLPLFGRMPRNSFTKEELVELWERIAREHELPMRLGETLEDIEQDAEGTFLVRTQSGTYLARNVCLAIGRRGTPRKLGVPGEELPKVAYGLLEASSYTGRRVLVVGGGDSAVETALGLAEQPGNEVVLSYRKDSFYRIRTRSQERLDEGIATGRLSVLMGSEVRAIGTDRVELTVASGGTSAPVMLPNDEVFVMAGGTLPFDLLANVGVSFDPSLRPPPPPLEEEGTGLVRALWIAFGLALATLLFAIWHGDYYLLDGHERPAHPKHPWLRPGLGLGLALGFASSALILVNLAYLLRRSALRFFRWGNLQTWMTSHVATGVLAILTAALHGAMAPRDTVGGHAFWALVILLLTGAIGRYFYAWVPRAANGRELELEELRARLDQLAADGTAAERGFQETARIRVAALAHERQWRGTFLGRLLALIGVRLDLRHMLHELRSEGEQRGIDPARIAETVELAGVVHRTALAVAHYEDLRALLGTWRYLHRWVAAGMVLLVALHVFYALAYGAHWGGGQ